MDIYDEPSRPTVFTRLGITGCCLLRLSLEAYVVGWLFIRTVGYIDDDHYVARKREREIAQLLHLAGWLVGYSLYGVQYSVTYLVYCGEENRDTAKTSFYVKGRGN